jgi:predicted nucleic acid-binding protein
VLLDELDLGEAETIVLARELGADWVLMDEKKARRKVTELGLNRVGTVGILLKAKQMGLLPQIRLELEYSYPSTCTLCGCTMQPFPVQ